MKSPDRANKKTSDMSRILGSNVVPFAPSDLPFDDQGRIYHLQIKPEQLAPNILIVGDPGRARMIGSTFFEHVEFEHEHRGLVTITGMPHQDNLQPGGFAPVRTTITTSGMGTPSLEIILQELVALNEIDIARRLPKNTFPRLHIIRVGTSGGLQPTTQLGTPIISSYSIGLDNCGLYYEVPFADDNCQKIERDIRDLIDKKMKPHSRFANSIYPYVARAEPKLVHILSESADLLGIDYKLGLTVSCGGFFAPQGRDITRIHPSISDLDQILSDYDPDVDGQIIENMEMESSFLFHFFGGLGYWSAAICTAIANRRLNTFDSNYQQSIQLSIRTALLALSIARSRFP